MVVNCYKINDKTFGIIYKMEVNEFEFQFASEDEQVKFLSWVCENSRSTIKSLAQQGYSHVKRKKKWG